MRLDRRSRAVRAALVLPAVATLVVSAGCSSTVSGMAVLAGPQIGQPVQWGPCRVAGGGGGNALPIPAGAECGKIAVPVDYAKPDGPAATLALIRFPATGQKIGSLIINPGGPGESGIEAASSIVENLPSSVRQGFDMVGFDPRGVGSSTPALWCNSDADNDRLRADPQVDYSPKGVEHIENETKAFVQRCVDKMGKDFLENVGTANVAKDLDALRAAVGDDKLTYLGYSYGTRIGSAYAEAYPDKVRAMILDGAVDPNADPIQADIDQAAAFQQAFNDYAADCVKDPSCPLGNDADKAVDVYRSLVDPLVDRPLPTSDPRGLGYSDAIIGTIMALYSPNLWRHLTQGLTEMTRGRGDTMLALADMYMRRDARGHYTNATDARIAVNCVDQPPITDRQKVIAEDKKMREVAPFMSYGDFTGHAPLSTCAFWPVPPTSTPHAVKAPGLPPVLVVSTTNDPATPYQAGVDLAKQLGGALLTFKGTQHTVVFQGNTCVDNYAAAYLVDLKLPPPGATC
ncbi:alpha/beta hydrolase [Mycobacterium sp. ENV421]|uniref:alpha/beta hydrolase n=1 Tax=Mycobacterium sp. ENV421 TaxID=1213407 RepID=UPI000C9A4BEF|nr:alpha/beta hydrolase [Mycobacterium sp. ENV421]PND59372.1 alpha/beta hydrolase [Mycobacterium sp. ENV421]